MKIAVTHSAHDARNTKKNRVMGKSTGLLTSHSGEQVLKDHYIDSTILTAIEEATLKIRVFGT
jgi:hypothetical protein